MTPETNEAAPGATPGAEQRLQRQKWTLTQAAFDAFLGGLDADRDTAAEKYLDLRRRLVRFFEWRGCPFPEDHADEAVNRVARRAIEGESIDNTVGYVLGTARLLALEIHKELARERQALGELAHTASPADDAEEPRVACLQHCLAAMPSGNRTLILEYYRGDKGAKIENRKRLTERLQVSINSLRMRALRLREGLQECVESCVRRDELPGSAT